ncbi:hypothetical protein KFL_001810150 [Klebsormidium nitens]|uniref:Uncharacterized protein n=1 Tax=Klebsormidium nitens TaxID=105231 RepID=A0A1Y1I001_KLENI|nr:hypothetical protein KFL_001810150 [Klebsormidium nitens]|eukprot:GAQ84235.1 hypothetical protein KFL_001810150 [Klebsormidium nitens]
MEDPLEYELLPLPHEITHRIVLACRKDVSVEQLSNLRLLNNPGKPPSKPAGWKKENCKDEVQSLCAKQRHSPVLTQLDPTFLQLRERDGLTAILLSDADASDKWLARERPASTPPGEKAFRRTQSLRRFDFQDSVTGVVPVSFRCNSAGLPVTRPSGTGCLVMGQSSAVLLRDGSEAQERRVKPALAWGTRVGGLSGYLGVPIFGRWCEEQRKRGG